MLCGGVDVGGDHVRFDGVLLDLGRGLRMADGVDQAEEIHGAVAVAQFGKGPDRPERGVGVLAAVLTHARRVALDVAGLQGRPVEGRREELEIERGDPRRAARRDRRAPVH